MHQGSVDALISCIYDAALDGSRWPDVVTGLARATGSKIATLMMFDEEAGLRPGIAPDIDPAVTQAYRDHWGNQFALWRRVRHVPVGKVIRAADVIDLDAFRAMPIYHEWWRPQGMRWPSCGCKLIGDGFTTAMLSLNKPVEADDFSAGELRLVQALVGHIIRSMGIYRRLRNAEARPVGGAPVPDGFAVVDRKLRILACGEATRSHLFAAGLIVANAMVDRIESPGLAIERLVGAAAGSGRSAPRGGDYHHVAADGSRLRISVIPCSGIDGQRADWLIVDRPAALLLIQAPADRARATTERLMSRHDLTRAEAAVAVEIARGDGRAAVAARLGIRETTVRSHLSAIFDKLGLHRQAELAVLVGGDGHGATGTG